MSNHLQTILVINLEKSRDRYNFIEKQIKRLLPDTNLIRIEAVDGQKLIEIPQIASTYYNTEKKRRLAGGCALSHYSCWKHIVDHNLKSAIIFEDDVTLTEEIKSLNRLNIPPDWDIFFIGYQSKIDMGNRIPHSKFLNNNNKIFKRINNHIIKSTRNHSNEVYGCYAYSVSNKGAKWLINNYALDVLDPPDMMIPKSSEFINIYYIYPKLCLHLSTFDSTLVEPEVQPKYSLRYAMISHHHINIVGIVLFAVLITTMMFLIYIIYTKYKGNKYFKISLLVVSVAFILVLYLYRNRFFLSREKESTFLDKINTHMDLIDFGSIPIRTIYHDSFRNVWTNRAKELGKAMLNSVHTVCSQREISYSLIFGSLLGWARHNSNPIPWDDDIDIVVDGNRITDFITGISDIPNIVIVKPHKLYYKIFHTKGLPIYRWNNEITWPFIDVYVYDTTPSGISINDDHDGLSTYSMTTPLKFTSTTFMETPVKVFSEYKDILNTQYGFDWHEQCKSTSWIHRFEIQVDADLIKEERFDILTFTDSDVIKEVI